MSEFMDSGVYSRDGLEWRGEHLLQHVGLGPGNGIVVSDECRLPSQLWSVVLTSCCQSTSGPASSSTAPSAAWAA